MRKLIKWTFLLTVLLLFAIFGTNYWVTSNAKEKLYTSVENIPKNKVGLVLGTSKFNKRGYLNYYYKYRIEAAIQLYKAGKIEAIIVSGDNGNKQYDEPTQMKEDLVAGGVPEEVIYLDYAGFRTLDSIVRADKIFGQKKFTIISQKFHNERALFLGESFGYKVIGFNAKSIVVKYGMKTLVREKFARVKMLIDLTFGIQPKFLGDPVPIK